MRRMEASTHGPFTCEAQRPTPYGYVYVTGDFFSAHRLEVEAVLRYESRQVLAENPHAWIMPCGDDATGGMLITTADESLAERLGRSLQTAFDNQLQVHFSHEDTLTLSTGGAECSSRRARRVVMSYRMIGFVIGGAVVMAAAAGCAVGLMLAPASGVELRRRIAWRLDDGRQMLARNIERLKEHASGYSRTERSSAHQSVA